MIDPSDERYVFMPEDQILAARGSAYAQVIRDHFWSVHPEKGLRFWQGTRGRKGLVGASPQANSNESIVRRLLCQGDQVKQIPLVLAPINIGDYRD